MDRIDDRLYPGTEVPDQTEEDIVFKGIHETIYQDEQNLVGQNELEGTVGLAQSPGKGDGELLDSLAVAAKKIQVQDPQNPVDDDR